MTRKPGKEIAYNIYVHRRYARQVVPNIEQYEAMLPRDYRYTIVKYHRSSQTVEFIQSIDFDTADEPTVGGRIIVRGDGSTTVRPPPKGDPLIYHHKWMMVGDDYQGFDVEASKRRSARWTSLPDVDRHRIGRKSYWERFVLPRLHEAYG